jgi:carboxymethylenebutenolidase
VRINVAISLAGGGALAGVLALPAGSCDPPVPGVIVLHEVFGPAPDILDAADRFAEHGYAALTPDLFSAGRRLGCLARAMIESSRGCRARSPRLSRPVAPGCATNTAGRPGSIDAEPTGTVLSAGGGGGGGGNWR